MFTGLIECMGTVVLVQHKGTSISLGVNPDIPDFSVAPGGSVAIDGACLTAEKIQGKTIFFSAVKETLERTTLGKAVLGRRVNCERALEVKSRFDGHIVLGHVDGVGVLEQDQDLGGSIRRTFAVPENLMKFMAQKGSVAIDGVSLTIASVGDCRITVSLIPATIQKTTMSVKKKNDTVNLECDVLARYLDNLLNYKTKVSESGSSGSLLDNLERFGF
ncbi:MAG: riboflavin synthase [Fibrobacter sp.]|nr:riboflavin synthase [Fibrobacter sp.]